MKQATLITTKKIPLLLVIITAGVWGNTAINKKNIVANSKPIVEINVAAPMQNNKAGNAACNQGSINTIPGYQYQYGASIPVVEGYH